MMAVKTTVLRKMEYSGTFIYILQYKFTFQYLFAWENEVYRQEINMRPHLLSWRLWGWLVGGLAVPYSKNQIEQGEQIMISGAMKSIEALKEDVSGRQRRKAEREAKQQVNVNSDCQWQARTDVDGMPMLLCLTHDKTSLIQDNPKHD